MLKSTAVVGSMTLISRLLGFVRDLLIARTFGADAATDAFFVAFRIPNFLRRLFAEGAFSQGLVPILSELRASTDDAATRRALGRMAGTLALAAALLTALGMAAAPILTLLFAPGFHDHPIQYGMAVEMLRITFPYLFFVTLTAFAGGVLHTWGQFAVPALTPALLNLAMIAAALWLAPLMERPVEALAWGVFAAGILQLVFQLPSLWGIRQIALPRPAWRDREVLRMFKLMGPAILGVSATQINLLLDTLVASFLVSGSVSWLYYSDRLVELPQGLLGVAIGTAILPHLSANHLGRDRDGFSRALDWALRWVALLGLPATLGLMILAKPLVSTLFEHNEFSSYDVEMASRSLVTYAAGLPGAIAVKALASGFSARQDVRTPLRYSLHAIGANCALAPALAFLLAPHGWGHAGLALATAAAASLNALLLLGKLLAERAYRPSASWRSYAARLVVANTAMSALLVQALDSPWADWSTPDRIVHLALWLGAGIAIYLLCLLLTGLRPRHMLLPERA
ncbi:murein biosynthesis integral membrane protein MurJ [Methylococcus mesophilus]|uniref:murein biosynthesis integral membrane protein MurJ n=1 Tax=Methylococcus mesophilus TaxID=2993564 RepID=UPI00224B8987|nr:murein biosynthesis integral membrane protein MurJ [Methylococcus mesophilus]UZR28477.1 murein biosynthesis integral membrane protein MurJ [Methylococcus mesophilus]